VAARPGRDPTSRFTTLVERSGGDLPLDEAALLVAAHALPDLEVAAQLARLDDLARHVPTPTVEGLTRHLVHDLGFTGDRRTYHDARNSLLPEVLDRRSGIPLSLSIVAMEVGRRCGVHLVGIGMPGHFLVRPAEHHDRFVDLFDGGALLDRAGCHAIFQRLHETGTWQERYLEPVTNVEIVARMLANLANAYRRVGDRTALCWAMDLRLRLPGATERDRRELAVLLGAAGRYDEAATVLEASRADRDQESAQRLRARLN
jgi:regulator of sirC expression with transglutaminase-like and TPR domain